MRRPPLVLTVGEPAGIGPDVALSLARNPIDVGIVVVGDRRTLSERADMLGVTVAFDAFRDDLPPRPPTPGRITLLDVPLARPIEPGRPDPANGPALLAGLRTAIRGCLSGRFSALVTGPINKAVINESGTPFTGHTEFLADETGTSQVVMMLTAPGLRVALVTTHLPLRAVPDALTPGRLRNTLSITDRGLREHYGIPRPRILVCGLNPHAGEDGHLGHEDAEIIAPIVSALRTEGLAIEGPLPADTVFTPRYLERADVVVAIYHDQGLPVLKHLGFGRAVNVTLGLPFVRTSVDHGTAFDLAGTGRADPGSLHAAIAEAAAMTGIRRKRPN